MKLVRINAIAMLAGFALLLPAAGAAQDNNEVLRGRVLEDGKKPVAGASITVTGLNTQAVRTAMSDAKGSFTLLFSPPEGDYIVSVRKIVYSPATFRSTRLGLSNVMILGDISLTCVAVHLD